MSPISSFVDDPLVDMKMRVAVIPAIITIMAIAPPITLHKVMLGWTVSAGGNNCANYTEKSEDMSVLTMNV